MKPLLLIDFYRTLSHDKFWRGLEKELREKVEHFIFGLHPELVEEWMEGKRTSEEINQLVAKEFSLDYGRLWEIFVSDAKTMHIEKSDLDAISLLREKHRVILVTDNMDSFGRFTIPAQRLNTYFDEIVSSHSHRARKNRELFENIVSGHRADISKSVLIDDSSEHCQAFTDIGGKAFQATEPLPR